MILAHAFEALLRNAQLVTEAQNERIARLVAMSRGVITRLAGLQKSNEGLWFLVVRLRSWLYQQPDQHGSSVEADRYKSRQTRLAQLKRLVQRGAQLVNQL